MYIKDVDNLKVYGKEFYRELKNIGLEIVQARQDFDYAEKDFVDAAIYRLKYLEERFNVLNRKFKEEIPDELRKTIVDEEI